MSIEISKMISEEQPSLLFHSVPKLSNIAAMKVSLLLVHKKIVDKYPWNQRANDELYATLCLKTTYDVIPLSIHNWEKIYTLMGLSTWKGAPEILFLANELAVDENVCVSDISPWARDEIPLEVNRIINRAGGQIAYELWSWLYSHCNVFNDRKTLEIIIFVLFDEFAWHPDGTLNNEKTAENLVRNPKLCDFDKFSLACEYCMENEIRRLWPAVVKDRKIKNVVFRKQSIVYYWICNMKGKLQDVPLLDGQTVEGDMIEIKKNHNRSSIEYFWNFLNPEEQTLKIVRLLFNTYDYVEAVLVLIEKLSDEQFTELVVSIGDELMKIVLKKITYPKYLSRLWIRMKDIISENQFYKIVLHILEHECEITAGFAYSSQLIEKFQQIWITASDQLKQYTLNELISDEGVFSKYRESSPKKLLRRMDFLICMLHDATDEQRSIIWQENWLHFIDGVHPRYLRKLMDLCMDENDIAIFKEVEMTNYTNIEDYCVSLMADCCFAELEIFLDFCTSYDDRKKAFLKKQIELSKRKYVFSLKYSKMLDRLD